MSFHSYPYYIHGRFCSNFTVYSSMKTLSSHYHVPGTAGENRFQKENFQALTVIKRAKRRKRSLSLKLP